MLAYTIFNIIVDCSSFITYETRLIYKLLNRPQHNILRKHHLADQRDFRISI